MAAIRMLFSWLTEKGVLAMNPAREVKTERFSRTEGKTPAFVEGEVQKLLNTIETSRHTALRAQTILRGPLLPTRMHPAGQALAQASHAMHRSIWYVWNPRVRPCTVGATSGYCTTTVRAK
jgi:hypothetical protein